MENCGSCPFVRGARKDLGFGYCPKLGTLVFLEDQCLRPGGVPENVIGITWVANTEVGPGLDRSGEKEDFRDLTVTSEEPEWVEEIGYMSSVKNDKGIHEVLDEVKLAEGEPVPFKDVLGFLESLLPGLKDIYKTPDYLKITVERISGNP